MYIATVQTTCFKKSKQWRNRFSRAEARSFSRSARIEAKTSAAAAAVVTGEFCELS